MSAGRYTATSASKAGRCVVHRGRNPLTQASSSTLTGKSLTEGDGRDAGATMRPTFLVRTGMLESPPWSEEPNGPATSNPDVVPCRTSSPPPNLPAAGLRSPAQRTTIPNAMARVNRSSKLILVVDDAVELVETFKLILEAEGYHVAVADDGRKGLELAARLRPDLVLLDMMMPEIDGLEFLARIKREIDEPLPRVVALSGFDRFRPLALERGARAFVRKPIDVDELVSLVDSTLADEPLDGRAFLEHERAVDAARAAGAKARVELWSSGARRKERFRADTRRLLDALAGYFAIPKATFKVILNGTVYVLAQSVGPERLELPEDVPCDAEQTFDRDVVRANSTALFEDATKHPFWAKHPECPYGIRFWVAAPILKSGVAVGTLCLVDTVPRELRAEDLAVLGRFGELIGASIGDDAGRIREAPIVLPCGLFDREAFELLTNAALRRIERDGGTVGVSVAEVEDDEGGTTSRTERALRDVFDAIGRERAVVARIAPRTLALTVDGKKREEIQRRLESGLCAIIRNERIRSNGVASFSIDAGRPPLADALDLVHAAMPWLRLRRTAQLSKAA
jgi:CheY-like chemotaxis protein